MHSTMMKCYSFTRVTDTEDVDAKTVAGKINNEIMNHHEI